MGRPPPATSTTTEPRAVPIDPAPPQFIDGDGVRLRLAGPDDVPTLAAIVAEPEVAPWWPLSRPAEEEFLDPDAPAYVVEVDGEPAGVMHFHEENEPGYRHAGMDVALAARFHGRGLGRRALVAMARHLIHERGHHRLTIDPAAANTRAIAAYERVGFRPVGRMRAYERGPDGTWRDGLLMDMLASELVEDPSG
jgi:aminoglycoside 6'-N-acetyltransferase